MKILDLSEQFKKEKVKVNEKDKKLIELSIMGPRVLKLETMVKEKDCQIETLKSVTSEQSEIKGKQMLEVIKASRASEVL
jgi:hypothetical protein